MRAEAGGDDKSCQETGYILKVELVWFLTEWIVECEKGLLKNTAWTDS